MQDMRYLHKMGCIDDERMEVLEKHYMSGELDNRMEKLAESNDYLTSVPPPIGRKKKLTKAKKKAQKKARRLQRA
jgi:hypothetical protein